MAGIDAQKLIEYLKEKWQGAACPMCRQSKWMVKEKVFELREFSEGNLLVGGSVMPILPVICANCGNTILVNAITGGLIDAAKGDQK